MKNIFLTLGVCLIASVNSNAQTSGSLVAENANFENQTVLWAAADEGTATLRFDAGETTFADAILNGENPDFGAIISISLRRVSTPVDGSGIIGLGDYWTPYIQAYNESSNVQTIELYQTAVIPAGYTSTIKIKVDVEADTTEDQPGNGFLMSITPGTRQEQSNDPDDEIETYTQRCTAAPNLAGTAETTQIGISTLDRGTDDRWATDSKSGFIKLESRSLGFVPTRMTTAQRDAIESPEEGMVIYNRDTECLELYTGTEWICTRNKCKS